MYVHVWSMYKTCMYYSTVHTRLIHTSDMYVHVYARWVGFQMIANNRNSICWWPETVAVTAAPPACQWPSPSPGWPTECQPEWHAGAPSLSQAHHDFRVALALATQALSESCRCRLGHSELAWVPRPARPVTVRVGLMMRAARTSGTPTRYIVGIYHVYSEGRDIPGISQVYTLNIEILFSWIYGQVNAVSQNNHWGESNVEGRNDEEA